MPNIADAAKRVLLGRPVRSERLGRTFLPKRVALPVFASDALSSVAYAPDEVILTLSIAGASAYVMSPLVGVAVAVVLLTVVASYRQTVHAYPSGGGDYEVASENLGPRAGVAVASALLVDYVLTVAVSISAGAHYLAAIVPAVRENEVRWAVLIVAILALVNLRGLRESARAVAVPVYVFMGSIGLLILVGFAQSLAGSLAPAASAEFVLAAEPGFEEGLTGLAGAFLILRAFSSGCAALTGIEAVGNGVPAFRRPRSRNAATTLLALGVIAVVMITSLLTLAQQAGVRYVEDPQRQLVQASGDPLPADYEQFPMIGQLADAVFRDFPVLFYLIMAATGAILVLAAGTAFTGFPVLGSVLAKDGYLPRQLHNRGDRLVFSNGIVILAISAIALIVIFDAQVTRLIQLYLVGVFVSFTLSQLAMRRHWARRLPLEVLPSGRRRMLRSQAINTVGMTMTALVLLVVLATKMTQGAWAAILLIVLSYLAMRGVKVHYDRVYDELSVSDMAAARALPSRVHAIVLVSKVHKPTMRAVAYARATRPSVIEALTVGVGDDVAEIRREWDAAELPVPLTVLDSPYREITRPVLEYVGSIRRESPRDLIVVFVPEYVLGRRWQQLLHNQSARRLMRKLRLTPGVVVASVPWQLESARTEAATFSAAADD